MNGLDWTLLIAGGALGAGARYLLDGAIMRGRKAAFPVGILVVNIIGSFLLGLITGLGALVSPTWVAIIGVGVLGGFTTFSAFSMEFWALFERGQSAQAFAYVAASVVGAIAACGIGLLTMRQVSA